MSDGRRQNAQPGAARPRRPDFATIFGPFLGLGLVVGLFSALIWLRGGPADLERFLSVSNLKLMAVHAAIPGTVALGMTIVMISGGIDLSVGYVVSLVTVATMLVFRACAGQPALAALASPLAVLAGIATGLVCGAANGVLITSCKVVPFVVTLGMMGVARGLAQYLTEGTPLPFPDPANPPGWVRWLGTIEPEPAFLLVGPSVHTLLVLAVVSALLLRYTVLGRYCYALGSNEATARLCGIPVERTKVILYALAGLLTGWGGILQLSRSGAGLHDVAAGLELDVIAAVVIGGGSLTGGEGTVSGTLIGALMITVLGNGCSKLRLSMEFRFIIIGLIIVVVSAMNRWRQQHR